jgi:hypothetical protein
VDDDLIFRNHVIVRAIPDARGRCQAKEWFETLPARDRKRADAGLASFDLSFESKRGYAGRLEKIEGSREGLLELKLTRGGTPGPQLRFLGVWRGDAFFVVVGFIKKSPAVPRSRIRTAARTVTDWKQAHDHTTRRRRK